MLVKTLTEQCASVNSKSSFNKDDETIACFWKVKFLLVVDSRNNKSHNLISTQRVTVCLLLSQHDHDIDTHSSLSSPHSEQFLFFFHKDTHTWTRVRIPEESVWSWKREKSEIYYYLTYSLILLNSEVLQVWWRSQCSGFHLGIFSVLASRFQSGQKFTQLQCVKHCSFKIKAP